MGKTRNLKEAGSDHVVPLLGLSMKKQTPVDSGQARSQTQLVAELWLEPGSSAFRFVLNFPYLTWRFLFGSPALRGYV